ncbi:MAG: class I SAM-dependent methyltransferase [Acidimicrobiales bacterium]
MGESWTQPDRYLADTANSLNLGRALDVGCGTGADALWLADQGWDVTAVDSSKQATERVRQTAIEWHLPITVVRVDGREFKCEEPFQFVSLCYLHLEEHIRAELLSNVAALVAPGGTLIWRSFDAKTVDPGISEELLTTWNAVVEDLGDSLIVKQAGAAEEYFPYLGRRMRLLTVNAVRPV